MKFSGSVAKTQLVKSFPHNFANRRIMQSRLKILSALPSGAGKVNKHLLHAINVRTSNYNDNDSLV